MGLGNLLTYIDEQGRKSALQDYAQQTYGQSNPGLAALAKADPELFRSVMPDIIKHEQEGNAIAKVYGQQQQPASEPMPQGVPMDASSALARMAQPVPQQPDNTEKYRAMAYLPSSLQSVAAQQMMAEGMSNGSSALNSDIHGDDFLQTLKPTVASTVKAYAEGKMPVPTTGRSNNEFQALHPLIQQYDPDFDAADYKTRVSTRKAFTSGKEAQSINALNTVAEHLAKLKQAADAMHNGDLTAVNDVANWFGKQTGSDLKTNFDTIAGHVSQELTRVYRGSGGNQADIQRDLDNLNSGQSQKQFDTSFSSLGDLLKGKIDALQDQYKRGMGTSAKDTSFYTPQSAEAFKKFGLDIGGAPAAPATEAAPTAATSAAQAAPANKDALMQELKRRGMMK